MTKETKKKIAKIVIFGFIAILLGFNPVLSAIEKLFNCNFPFTIHMLPVYIILGILGIIMSIFGILYINEQIEEFFE